MLQLREWSNASDCLVSARYCRIEGTVWSTNQVDLMAGNDPLGGSGSGRCSHCKKQPPSKQGTGSSWGSMQMHWSLVLKT